MNKKFMLVVGLMAMMVAEVSHAANWAAGVGSGNWNTAANWNPADVPDTVSELASLTNNVNTGGPYTISVDSTMYPSGLTTGPFYTKNFSGTFQNSAKKILNVLNLTWNVGDPLSTVNSMYNSANQINATNSTLTFSGLAIGLYYDYRLVGSGWGVDFVDCTIKFNTPTGLVVAAASTITSAKGGPRMRMLGGTLVATNAAGNCINIIGGGNSTSTVSEAAAFALSNTVMIADNLSVVAAVFTYDGGSATSSVRSLYVGEKGYGSSPVGNGLAYFNSGVLNVGANVSFFNNKNIPLPGMFVVSGATVNVTGNFSFDGTSSQASVNSNGLQLSVSSGALNIGTNLSLMAKVAGTNEARVSVSGGRLSVGNTISLGSSSSSFQGDTWFEMSGGSVFASNIVVGYLNNANGFYVQTGGTNTVTGTLTLQTESGVFAAQRFVVQSNATMILKGDGMKIGGTGSWSATLLANSSADITQATNLVFMGKTIYDPVATTTNLAFGKDVGANLAGFTNAFASGTWDFTAVDGSEAVQVIKAGNFSGADSNAVYVSQIIGLTPATAATYLKSDVNIYYNSTRSTALLNTAVDIPGAGWLLPVSAGRLTGTMIWIQ